MDEDTLGFTLFYGLIGLAVLIAGGAAVVRRYKDRKAK